MNGSDAVEWKLADYLCKEDIVKFLNELSEWTWNFRMFEDIETFTGEFTSWEHESWFRSHEENRWDLDWKYRRNIPNEEQPWGKPDDPNQRAEFNILRDLRKFHWVHNDDKIGTIDTEKEYEHLNHYLGYVLKTKPFF